MKIVILSRGRMLYSTQRLAEAGRKRKHDVRVIDPYRCTFGIVEGRLILHCDGLPLTADVVIPRIGASSMPQGIPVLRHFELLGIPCLNDSSSILKSRDKLATHQLLAVAGIGVPNTLTVRDAAQLASAVTSLGCPIVIKLPTGTQGNGVMVAESEAAAVATVQTVWGLGQEVMLQQYIAEANGKDVRVFIVGDRVVGAMERSAADGEFRANIHLGASAAPIVISAEVEEIALKTASILGLQVAGVDVIESERGPLVLEANSSPGLQGIEGATGTDIARAIIVYAESLVANEEPSAN